MTVDTLIRAGFQVRESLTDESISPAVAARVESVVELLDPTPSRRLVARLFDDEGSVHLIASSSESRREAGVRLRADGAMTLSHCRTDVEPPIWLDLPFDAQVAARLLSVMDRELISKDSGYTGPSEAQTTLVEDES